MMSGVSRDSCPPGGTLKQMAAVVLAAGKGTRMKSDRAKVLHRAGGRPIAFYPIRAALSLDCAPVVVVVGHQAEQVETELGALFPGVKFALQQEQLGTGHAVLSAEQALAGLGGDVLILAADVPLIRPETLRKLVEAKKDADVSLLDCRAADARGYGRFIRYYNGEVV